MQPGRMAWAVAAAISAFALVSSIAGVVYFGGRALDEVVAGRGHAALVEESASQSALPVGAVPAEKWIGSMAWYRDSAKFLDDQNRSPAGKRYQRVRIYGDLYELIFEKQDFEAAEQELQRRSALTGDPFAAYEYSSTIDYLFAVRYGNDPDANMDVVVEWTNRRPDSHFAWLARGVYGMAYARYRRGTQTDERTSAEGLASYARWMNDAQVSLAKSAGLDPHDPEPHVALLDHARRDGAPLERARAHFENAVALSPAHLRAHQRYLMALIPGQGGNWSAVDLFLEECDRKSDEQGHALLRTVRYSAYELMESSREGYSEVFNDRDRMAPVIQAYHAVEQRWPNSMMAKYNYLRMLYRGARYPDAIKLFDELGDVFFQPSEWDTLAQYAYARAFAYYGHARMSPVFEQRVELLKKAIALEPHGQFLSQLAAEYKSKKDYAQAESYYVQALEADPEYDNAWHGLADLYITTGRRDEALRVIDRSRQYQIAEKIRALMDEFERKLTSGASPAP